MVTTATGTNRFGKTLMAVSTESTQSASRLQLLADLGITPWVSRGRTVPPAQPAEVDVPAAASNAPSIPAGSRAALNALVGSFAEPAATANTPTDAPNSGARTSAAANVEASAVAQAVASSPLAHPEVGCLYSRGALLLLPIPDLQGQIRLAKDLLAACSGGWQQSVEQVVFRWSDLVAAGMQANQAESAFLAFAEKRIEVAAARWVLVSHNLQPLLAPLVTLAQAQLLALDPLATLGSDAIAKQALWQAIQRSGNAGG